VEDPSGFDSTVGPRVADVCFTVLYNIPKDSDLVSIITLISDYLCIHHLFREAFELNYTLLDNLVFGSAIGEESFVAALIASLKTATTPVQQQVMTDMADAALSCFSLSSDSSNWFVITVKLYQSGFSPWSPHTDAYLPLCEHLRSRGRFYIKSSSSAKRRECIENAIRERWQFSFDTTRVFRSNGDAFEYWNRPSIVALTS